MPEIKIAVLENSLYIKIKSFTSALMPAYVHRIEAACSRLITGFTCLIELRAAGLVRQRDIDLLASTVDLISAYGAARVAYLVSGQKTSALSFPTMALAQSFVPVSQVHSFREAKALLDWKSSAAERPVLPRLQ